MSADDYRRSLGDDAMRFLIVLEPDAEGGYTVTVPALPGCITQGPTLDDAIARAKPAIALYVQDETPEGLVAAGIRQDAVVAEIEVPASSAQARRKRHQMLGIVFGVDETVVPGRAAQTTAPVLSRCPPCIPPAGPAMILPTRRISARRGPLAASHGRRSAAWIRSP